MNLPISLKSRALNYLARRDHSKQELINKLTPFAPLSAIIEVISYLENLGFIDDARFIRNYITYKQSKLGLKRIKLELYRKVGNIALVDKTLENYDLNQADVAYIIWNKKFSYSSDYNQRCKQIRFLLYRGFSMDIINQVLALAKDAN